MIGAARYFSPRYWARRYWPHGGQAVVSVPGKATLTFATAARSSMAFTAGGATVAFAVQPGSALAFSAPGAEIAFTSGGASLEFGPA